MLDLRALPPSKFKNPSELPAKDLMSLIAAFRQPITATLAKPNTTASPNSCASFLIFAARLEA